MNKKHLIVHLSSSRPGFSQTITDKERGVMQVHVTYCTKLIQQSTALAFGFVLHPKGTYGMSIMATDNEEQLQELFL